MPVSSTEDNTQLCTPRDRNPECLPNNEENRKRGTFLLFFSDKFWCKKLTSNTLSMSNTLLLSKDLHYLLPPSPTDLCFLFFISSLYPLPLSSFIPSSLLFLNFP